MKRLLENWRQFITELEEPIKTLRIFDFDETIAHTQSETRARAPDGPPAVPPRRPYSSDCKYS